eukprot:6200095-Pleurochrysis_carterae.AAC.5
MTINVNTNSLSMVWERARARGLGAPSGRLWERGAQQAAAAMRERGAQSLVSGARALSKYYACDTTAVWEIVHASDEIKCARRRLRELYGAQRSKRSLMGLRPKR